ncbi:hypothetical protein, partial [Mesorhizobium sp. M2C.T.Ca.TU.002.02.1.1]|uniref:hypothetical protein n=1 Tax=Mesorhizobium sp. M2C.T.Ca.TU.002.02.1.1 TaxID=2496788 RepID=UPI000FD39783
MASLVQTPARHDATDEEILQRQLADAFPGDLHQAWIRARRRLSGAGYGEGVTDAYVRLSPQIARLVSPQTAVDLAGVVSGVAIRAGRAAAALLP